MRAPDLVDCILRVYEYCEMSSITGFFPGARQIGAQDGGAAASLAGRGRPGWPMAVHQLASTYNSSHGEAACPLKAE